TTHLKLINTIAKAVVELNLPKEHDHSVLISCKASTMYYPTLHLELVRCVAHAGRAGYELPWTVSRLVGMPPPALAK
ncbi:hypothetical protein C8R44DRAFT_559634, partial [Mycena epipterygia]